MAALRLWRYCKVNSLIKSLISNFQQEYIFTNRLLPSFTEIYVEALKSGWWRPLQDFWGGDGRHRDVAKTFFLYYIYICRYLCVWVELEFIVVAISLKSNRRVRHLTHFHSTNKNVRTHTHTILTPKHTHTSSCTHTRYTNTHTVHLSLSHTVLGFAVCKMFSISLSLSLSWRNCGIQVREENRRHTKMWALPASGHDIRSRLQRNGTSSDVRRVAAHNSELCGTDFIGGAQSNAERRRHKKR